MSERTSASDTLHQFGWSAFGSYRTDADNWSAGASATWNRWTPVFSLSATSVESYPNDEPIGTGPYRFSEWQKGASLTVARNDDWWGTPPGPATITWVRYDNSDVMGQALRSGELDVADPDALVTQSAGWSAAVTRSGPWQDATRIFAQLCQRLCNERTARLPIQGVILATPIALLQSDDRTRLAVQAMQNDLGILRATLGIETPIWKSSNAPGGDDWNARYFARFADRVAEIGRAHV